MFIIHEDLAEGPCKQGYPRPSGEGPPRSLTVSSGGVESFSKQREFQVDRTTSVPRDCVLPARPSATSRAGANIFGTTNLEHLFPTKPNKMKELESHTGDHQDQPPREHAKVTVDDRAIDLQGAFSTSQVPGKDAHGSVSNLIEQINASSSSHGPVADARGSIDMVTDCFSQTLNY